MKTLLIPTIALAILAGHACLGQGTITFANSLLTQALWEDPVTHAMVPIPPGAPVVYGVLWGTAADDLRLNDGPLGTPHPTTPGIISAASTYPIVGGAEGALVFMKIAMWHSSFGRDFAASRDTCTFYGETAVRQILLGPATGQGTLIWSPTNPTLFQPLRPMVCPEPSVMALGIVGAGAALLRWRRSSKSKR